MFELLVSQGHREADLFEHSLDKLRDLFTLACQRREKEFSRIELAVLTGVASATGLWKAKNGAAAFRQHHGTLMKTLTGSAQAAAQTDTKKNRKAHLARLVALGATTTG